MNYSDTTYVVDTVLLEDGTRQLVKSVDKVTPKTITKDKAIFDPSYANRYKAIVNPVMDKAQAAGYKVYAITGYNDPAILDDFRHETQSAYPFHTADDILLKTIVRSNPGIVLLKNGEILGKWHYKKLPDWETLQQIK